MNRIYKRLEVYVLYFYEYLRYAEFASLYQAFVFIFTGKTTAKQKVVRSSMGQFLVRAETLDFQYINYAYEIDIKRFLLHEKFDVFMDIGACLGEYSIWLGKNGKKCLAFEPVVDSFQMIEHNIQLNKVAEHVKAYNYGLGKHNSIENFKINHTNPGASKRVAQKDSNTFELQIFKLDDIFEQFEIKQTDRIAIKIDVEGMEVEMLEGAQNFLKHFPHVVLIIEEKLSGAGEIQNILNQIGKFEFGIIDQFNIYARKIA
jgi:FkbM family methyltransferase